MTVAEKIISKQKTINLSTDVKSKVSSVHCSSLLTPRASDTVSTLCDYTHTPPFLVGDDLHKHTSWPPHQSRCQAHTYQYRITPFSPISQIVSNPYNKYLAITENLYYNFVCIFRNGMLFFFFIETWEETPLWRTKYRRY